MSRVRFLSRLARLPPEADLLEAIEELRDLLPQDARAGIVLLGADAPASLVSTRRARERPPPLPGLVRRVVEAGEAVRLTAAGPAIYREPPLDDYLRGLELYVAPVLLGGRAVAAIWSAAPRIDDETSATVDEAALAIGMRISLVDRPAAATRPPEAERARVYEHAAQGRTGEALSEAGRMLRIRCELLDPGVAQAPGCTCAHHSVAAVTAAGREFGRLVIHSSRPIASATLDELLAIARIGMLAERVGEAPTEPGVATLAELATFSDPPWLSVGSLERSALAAPLVAVLVSRCDGGRAHAHQRELLAAVSAALGPATVRSPMGTRAGQVLILLGRHDLAPARRIAQRIIVEASARGIEARCFLSGRGTPVDAGRLIAEVERLALMGHRLRLPAGVVDSSSIGPYAVLLEAAEPGRLADWAERLIGPLIAYDEKHGASLVGTLEAYLEEWGHVAACAARIFVHPNTLKYRLRRIHEILGVDPRDQRARRDLLLACYARVAAQALGDGVDDHAGLGAEPERGGAVLVSPERSGD
jgi:PucR C-terminal helix-turn-helix domain